MNHKLQTVKLINQFHYLIVEYSRSITIDNVMLLTIKIISHPLGPYLHIAQGWPPYKALPAVHGAISGGLWDISREITKIAPSYLSSPLSVTNTFAFVLGR